MGMTHWALMAGALTIAGCGGGGNRAESSREPNRGTGGMTGHMDSGGMRTGGMNVQGVQMMSGMRAHMDTMMRMSPRQMQALMASHQAMMSRMLDTMGSDMRGMNMSGTPEWTALTDSVKRDLADLPNLKGQELESRMRAHADRVERLITMHQRMMRQ